MSCTCRTSGTLVLLNCCLPERKLKTNLPTSIALGPGLGPVREATQIIVFRASKSEWGIWIPEGREVKVGGDKRLWDRKRSRRITVLRGESQGQGL